MPERRTQSARDVRTWVTRRRGRGGRRSDHRGRGDTGARAGGAEYAAGGPPRRRGAGDEEGLRRFREPGGASAPGTSSRMSNAAQRRTGALGGCDQHLLAPPFRPGDRPGDRHQDPGALGDRLLAPPGPFLDPSPGPRKGFRKPLDRSRSPDLPGFARYAREVAPRADGGLDRGREASGEGLQGPPGGLDRQPRALRGRRQGPGERSRSTGRWSRNRFLGSVIVISTPESDGGARGAA